MRISDWSSDVCSSDLTTKLAAMGFLTITQTFDYSVYTSAVASAVKVIQRRAGLTVNGTTNSATWDAVFDISATGYSLTGAHVAPLYADPRTQPYLYTANGSVAGLNPDYDATVPVVHRTIAFGPGVTRAQATAWCVGQAARLASSE